MSDFLARCSTAHSLQQSQRGQVSAQAVRELSGVVEDHNARWVTPPKAGEECTVTGLSHAYLYKKILTGPFSPYIVQVSLREGRKTKGKRLIFAPSLDALLHATSNQFPERDRKRHLTELEANRFAAAADYPIPSAWIRVPPNGKSCRFTTLTHGQFYSLMADAGNSITVTQLRTEGESRASCMVYVPSLHRYLVKRAREQAVELSTRKVA